AQVGWTSRREFRSRQFRSAGISGSPSIPEVFRGRRGQSEQAECVQPRFGLLDGGGQFLPHPRSSDLGTITANAHFTPAAAPIPVCVEEQPTAIQTRAALGAR